MKTEMKIPIPSANEVQKWNDNWNNSEKMKKYRVQENCLEYIFKEFPLNNDREEVTLKVTLLNQFYYTHITGVQKVIEHILNLKIDERLGAKPVDVQLVNEIANVKFNDKIRNDFSFATKYCSFHFPKNYQIYDKYGSSFIKYWNDKDKFSVCKKSEYRDYASYIEIVDAFIKHYGLQKFTRKQIDRYIWQSGKKYFNKEK